MMEWLVVPLLSAAALVQAASQYSGPIIDMHVHVYARDPRWEADMDNPITGHKITAKTEAAHREATVAQFKKHNIVSAMVSNDLQVAYRWKEALGKSVQVIVGYGLDDPAAVNWDEVKREARAGRIDVLGECAPYYIGMGADDPRLEPLWQTALELDLPVAFHVHPGPPGGVHAGAKFASAENVSLKQLDKVLAHYPKLRLYVMHGGYPMIDEMLLLLYLHPQVYVDIAAINWSRPRAEFHRYLQRLVEAGYEDRIMFGSDQMVWPETIGVGVEAVDSAPFLSGAQKKKIFYENARRFLRMDR